MCTFSSSSRPGLHLADAFFVSAGILFFHVGIFCSVGLAESTTTQSVSEQSPETELPMLEPLPSAVPNSENPGISDLEADLDVFEPEFSPQSPVNSRYLLDTGDQLRVTVFNAPDYSGEFSVLAGGVVNVPLGGRTY